MRRRVELYINDHAVDLDEQSLILFNYTKDNIDNPSVIRNSYSKQVTLKGTARNNRIFEGMYREDRVTGTNSLSVLERIPFSIVADKGIVVERGYCKIDEIKTSGASHEYTVSLYGNLGAFFYNLATDVNGNGLTLADLTFAGSYNKNTHVGTDAASLNTRWNELKAYLQSGTMALGAVVNFNPCYNGIPDNFDADKVMVKAGDYTNTPSSIAGNYPKTPSNGKYLVVMNEKKDMQDTNDCRAYLMRPVLSVLATLNAVQAYATSIGQTFTIDSTILNADYTKKAWVAIANVPTSDRSQGYSLFGDLLAGSPSPATFIINFARLFGYSFVTDADGAVMMTSRNAFFNDNTLVDITHRVALDKGKTLAPVFADARYFDLALEGVGEIAKTHLDKFGREYGSQRVDTSYKYGEEVTNIYDGMVYKVAAVTEEQGVDHIRAAFTYVSTPNFLLPLTCSMVYANPATALMYNASGEQVEVDLPHPGMYEDEERMNGWFARHQLCEADRKAVEGIGVLMLIDGFKQTTIQHKQIRTSSEQVTVNIMPRLMYLHSYDAVMVGLNDGVECWNMTKSNTSRTDIPFWANVVSGKSILPTGIYANNWEDYITDRYDKDSRVLTCSVDFSGMQVGDALLRKFYYFAGALWALNRITNYSLTTYDAVECEFVRVKDITDYSNGQTL